jgi:hypothetical protein
MFPRARLAHLAPLLPVLCALAVWHPLRHSYFYGDDFLHLYDIVTKSLPRLLSQLWGGHLYVVRNAVFYGLLQVFGPDPRGYFWTVLVTHLLNTALLYVVIRRFSGDRWLACTGATLWGTCPTLEATLGWFSVYGQVLLTAIVLGVLADLGHVLEGGAVVSPRRAAAWAVALGLGSTCFGTGLGLAAVLPIATALTLPRKQLPWRSAGITFLGAAAALGMYQLFRAYSPEFSAEERLLTSVRALVPAIPNALVLSGHLLAFGTTTLLLGFLGLDRGYPSAVGSGAAAMAAMAVLAALWIADTSTRRRLLALALLAVAAYGSIALGRVYVVAMANLSLAAAAGNQPRWHYLPIALLAALLSTAFAVLAARGAAVRHTVHAGAALWMAARVVLLVVRPLAIQHWPQERADSAAFVKMVRDRVAATPPGQVALIENRPFGPTRLVPDALIGSVGAFVIFFPDDTVDGRTVRFAVSEHEWELAQKRGGRVAALVVRR